MCRYNGIREAGEEGRVHLLVGGEGGGGGVRGGSGEKMETVVLWRIPHDEHKRSFCYDRRNEVEKSFFFV